jgi:hypothetical protein
VENSWRTQFDQNIDQFVEAWFLKNIT